MKKIMFLLLLLCSSMAAASDWSEEDTQRQIAYHVLHVIDWRQTQDIARHPDMKETNIFLGEHPSNGQINAYMAISAIFVEIAAHNLPPDLRKKFQWFSILDTTYAVGNNAYLGLKVGF